MDIKSNCDCRMRNLRKKDDSELFSSNICIFYHTKSNAQNLGLNPTIVQHYGQSVPSQTLAKANGRLFSYLACFDHSHVLYL